MNPITNKNTTKQELSSFKAHLLSSTSITPSQLAMVSLGAIDSSLLMTTNPTKDDVVVGLQPDILGTIRQQGTNSYFLRVVMRTLPGFREALESLQINTLTSLVQIIFDLVVSNGGRFVEPRRIAQQAPLPVVWPQVAREKAENFIWQEVQRVWMWSKNISANYLLQQACLLDPGFASLWGNNPFLGVMDSTVFNNNPSASTLQSNADAVLTLLNSYNQTGETASPSYQALFGPPVVNETKSVLSESAILQSLFGGSSTSNSSSLFQNSIKDTTVAMLNGSAADPQGRAQQNGEVHPSSVIGSEGTMRLLNSTSKSSIVALLGKSVEGSSQQEHVLETNAAIVASVLSDTAQASESTIFGNQEERKESPMKYGSMGSQVNESQVDYEDETTHTRTSIKTKVSITTTKSRKKSKKKKQKSKHKLAGSQINMKMESKTPQALKEVKQGSGQPRVKHLFRRAEESTAKGRIRAKEESGSEAALLLLSRVASELNETHEVKS